jgi:serine/threonine protein kinase
MNSPVENIGRLSIFSAECLGSGRFGSVFPGKFLDVDEEVVIKKIEKSKVQVDSDAYLKANGQQNIVNYYTTDYSTDNKFGLKLSFIFTLIFFIFLS